MHGAEPHSHPSKPQVNAIDDLGWTPLHCAVAAGNLPLVQDLLHWGSNINTQTSNEDGKRTPLMIASEEQDNEMLQLLLDIPDTDHTLTDTKGRTALDVARES